MQKPSPKVFGIAIACILVILAVAWSKFQDKINVPSLSSGETISLMTGEEDTDGDGLADWREKLFQLDPNKTDTDEDGIKDGEEAKLLIPKATETTEASFSGSQASNSPETLTDSLARNLFVSYATLKSSSNLTPSAQEEATSNLLSQYYLLPARAIYSENNITIIKEPSSEEIKTYANLFASIEGEELEKLNTAQKNGTADSKALISTYANLIGRLSTISVPYAIAPAHVQALNSYYQMIQSITSLEVNAESDPYKAILSYQNFKDADNAKLSSYLAIQKYIINSGIIFDSSEPGNAWKTFQL